MMLRFLNIQGIAGLAVSVALAVLLVVQKVETRHWRKASAQFEQLYRGEQAAFAGTVANYRAAAADARSQDLANARRVEGAQSAITERTAYDFQARIAAARAAAVRLRARPAGAADPGGRAATAVPGLPAAAGGAAQGPGQDRLPQSDERAPRDRGALGPEDALTATEQAIQLDELIKWVEAQRRVDPKARP
jgi:hypothetical protein